MRKKMKGMKGFDEILKRNGYEFIRVKGSHFIYGKEGSNPIAVNKELNKMVMRRLLKENNLV